MAATTSVILGQRGLLSSLLSLDLVQICQIQVPQQPLQLLRFLLSPWQLLLCRQPFLSAPLVQLPLS